MQRIKIHRRAARAGPEAALHAAKRAAILSHIEMRPTAPPEAHQTSDLTRPNFVCSNSLSKS